MKALSLRKTNSTRLIIAALLLGIFSYFVFHAMTGTHWTICRPIRNT